SQHMGRCIPSTQVAWRDLLRECQPLQTGARVSDSVRVCIYDGPRCLQELFGVGGESDYLNCERLVTFYAGQLLSAVPQRRLGALLKVDNQLLDRGWDRELVAFWAGLPLHRLAHAMRLAPAFTSVT